MPSARIHEAVAKEVNKDYNYDELLLRIGTVAPDCWRNVENENGVKDKYLTHFWDFRVKQGQANDYEEFYFKYYNFLTNPFYFGYLVHLITDQYWKTFIDQKYETIVNGERMFKLKDGSYHDDKNWWGYFDSLKIQKQIAKLYKLDKLPIEKSDIPNFSCSIDELNLSGLFGLNGTLNYINTSLSPSQNDEESQIYDINEITNDIKITSFFVKSELQRLKNISETKKIKVAVDIDDTILCTKELENYYWNEFIRNHPEIDSNKNYHWGDEELSLFWQTYREQMAFGEIKPAVQESLNKLLNIGIQVDLLSARPLNKYVSLKKRLVEYFEEKDVNYTYMNLGFYSKAEFLKNHDYDILIDNELRHVNSAKLVGVDSILFGYNSSYSGYQTEDWKEIPLLVDEIIKKRKVQKTL